MEKKPKIIGYQAVVLSGSHACNHETFADGSYGLRHAIRCDCGYVHRTYEAAEKCRIKKVGYNQKTMTCSAKWYNSEVIHVYEGYKGTYLKMHEDY